MMPHHRAFIEALWQAPSIRQTGKSTQTGLRRGYVFFLSLLFSHCIVCLQSPTTTFCCCSPFSSHSFQIFLNTVLPSYYRSSSPSFFHHFLCIGSLLIFHLPFFPHVNFNILITSFFLKLFLPPTSMLSSSILLINSLHSHDSSYPVVFAF